ncbi:MAG TPA: hypothetical protein VJM31_19145 [Vicinamibacterales bacterium]|nr:hypothetical protein [Vicinamibacterales bacterium]
MTERNRAVLTLLALGALAIAALYGTKPSAMAGTVTGAIDIVTYRAILGKLRVGTPYYVAVGEELRQGRYATREVFNWRTPLHWSALSLVPEVVSRALLIAFGLVLCVATLVVTAQRPTVARWTAVTMQVGTLAIVSVPEAILMSETWAGVLIGLSVCAYSVQRPQLAVPLGLFALFVRELAAPYCVVCTVLALVHKRWCEAGTWLGGACLYAIYYGWHFTQINLHRLPSDLAHASSWLELGGLPSLLAKVHWHGWLLVTPMPLTAFALVLVVAGTAAAGAPRHVRLTSAAYLVFFLAAGKGFDAYWGTMAWPTWALAFGYGVAATRRAFRTAFARLPSTRLPST